ncbi:MAG: glycosyltransferase family 4 protein, partial [Chloroflexota bacterium]
PMHWACVSLGGKSVDLSHHLPFVLLTRDSPFDVVHDHGSGYMRWLRCGVRVAHFHSDPGFSGDRKERFHLAPTDFATICRHTDVRVAVSRFVAAEIERGMGQQQAVHIVSNGVDTDLYTPETWAATRTDLRQSWGIGDQETVFLFAGALTRSKGLIPLAHAFNSIFKTVPSTHLVIAGSDRLWGNTVTRSTNSDELETELRQLLETSLKSSHVHFLGKVPLMHMPSLYAASDVVVVPSICREGFGLVALEAMAGSLPVIASRVGGLPEIVNDQMGLLVEPGNVDQLVSAMLHLASDPELRALLGESGRQEARRYSWLRAAEQLDGIYRTHMPSGVPHVAAQ